MKHLLLILPVFVALASAQLTNVQLAIVNVAAHLDNNDETTKMCLRDTNMTSDAFSNVVAMLDRPYSTLINNKDVDKIRGAACLFTCFEKKEGRVSNSKIQLDKVEDWIERASMSLEMETYYKEMARECIIRVKGITDECFMGLEFYKCLLA
ncbi:hypothetical protein K0M31_007450 [Melipona bicolor]|uniref:Uncharacterized protein n=1 Tax=Melipona bicolor TaxID=60889 RepID=A0AA40KVP6_9HYME|nr:hypothetical protein K0M31_007450 [Melipona bicolor]